jgi:hypothetical protein
MIDFDRTGAAFVQLITQHLKASHLMEAIRKSSYSTPTIGGIERETMSSYWLTLTLFYPLFRAIKLYSRSAWQQKDITDENVKQVLLAILQDEGGEGQYSFKWNLLKELAWEMLTTVTLDSVKACDANQLIFAPRTEYNDNDVKELIGKIKDSLAPVAQMLTDASTKQAPLGYLGSATTSTTMSSISSSSSVNTSRVENNYS